jgi:hypothetical protein
MRFSWGDKQNRISSKEAEVAELKARSEELRNKVSMLRDPRWEWALANIIAPEKTRVALSRNIEIRTDDAGLRKYAVEQARIDGQLSQVSRFEAMRKVAESECDQMTEMYCQAMGELNRMLPEVSKSE